MRYAARPTYSSLASRAVAPMLVVPRPVSRAAGAPYPAAPDFNSPQPNSAWWVKVMPNGTRILFQTTGHVLVRLLQEALRARLPAGTPTYDGSRVSGSDVTVDGNPGPTTMKALWAQTSRLSPPSGLLDILRDDAVAQRISQRTLYTMIWVMSQTIAPESVPNGTSFEIPPGSTLMLYGQPTPAGPITPPTSSVLWQPSEGAADAASDDPTYGTPDWVKPPSTGTGDSGPKPPTGGTPPPPVGVPFTPSSARDTTLSPLVVAGGLAIVGAAALAVVWTNRSERKTSRRKRK